MNVNTAVQFKLEECKSEVHVRQENITVHLRGINVNTQRYILSGMNVNTKVQFKGNEYKNCSTF